MGILNSRGALRPMFVAILVCALCLAISAVVSFSLAEVQTTPLSVSKPRASESFEFADLVAAVRPAVVNISTTQKPRRSIFSQADVDGVFRDVVNPSLGPDAEHSLREHSWSEHTFGSGFIIDPGGYIVTNDHVVGDASEIRVVLGNGEIYRARVIGRDAKTDLALLKVTVAKPLPYVTFGNSDKERVGNWLVAMGNPYGLGSSVMAGILSGTNRNIDEGPYDDFLQLDASLNPGYSGGPLFNLSGRVIGVNTAIYSSTGGSVGVGFAIPSNIARKILTKLRKDGHVTRGWLGVQYQTVTPALAKAVGLHNVEGVLVDLAKYDLPAEHAGIRQGDVIVSFDGRHIRTLLDLALAVANIHAGRTVPVSVLRDDREHDLWVTVGTERAQNLAANNLDTRLKAPDRTGTSD